MLDKWVGLTKALGCPPAAADDVYRVITASYGDENRHYHNLQHIISCLHEFADVRHRLIDPVAVELAIWFHDLVYVPTSAYNEEISAATACGLIVRLGGPLPLAEKVAAMVRATNHQVNHNLTSDEQYLLDIDLAILGYPPALFQLFEKGVRQEYPFVTEQLYRVKRSELLNRFLMQGTIYHTDYFRSKYEQSARSNISTLLRHWKN